MTAETARAPLVAALLLALGAAGPLPLPRAPEPEDGWARIEAPLALEFPRDHGAHPDHRTEWWYTTGRLVGATGREYGFELTFFRAGLAPGDPAPGDSVWRARAALAAHLAVTDVAAGRTRFAERLGREGPGLARASRADLDVELGAWSVRRLPDGRIALEARDAAAGIALDLVLTPEKPLVRHGRGGVSVKGEEPGNASAYLSWTRLEVTGGLELDGASDTVRGTAWFDHEWGTSQLGEGVVGWDWFALQLDDGRDLMVYLLREEDGSPAGVSAGTLVDADGRARGLSLSDFEVEATRTWRSPRTGAVYPASWRVRVPSAGLDLEVLPPVADCELVTSESVDVTYWEGPVRVTGSHRGGGYIELVGYAGSLAGRF